MKKQVCIVTYGVFGVPEDNEQGEYTSNLAISLASSGYEVSILLANGLSSEYRDNITTIKAFCAGKNIKLFFLMQVNKDYFSYALKTDNLINSYQVYEWFKKHGEFDTIFFADNGGAGFYSLFAKHQGLKFQKTKFFVKVFHTLRQRLYKNKLNFDSICYITDDFIEKKTIELCDVLLFSSQDTLDYIKNISWKMPERVEILPDTACAEKVRDESTLIKLLEEPINNIDKNDGSYIMFLSHCKSDVLISEKRGIVEIPKVTVCLIHHERPQFLKYALDSLRKQDYQNLEVILVDDGSESNESLIYLDSLTIEFDEKRWKIIRQENLYPGAARNKGAKEASGEYIVFLDDDDYLKSYAVSTLVRAANYSNADVLTCFNEIFDGESEPDKNNTVKMSIFTGDIASGIFENSFGPITSFFKKSVFLEIGGFHELKGIAFEDWEIFAKLALKGYKIEVVPETLFYYRILKTNKDSINRSTDSYYNNQRVLDVYVREFDKNMSSALMYLKNAKNIGYRLDYLNNYIILLKQALKEKYGIVITDL